MVQVGAMIQRHSEVPDFRITEYKTSCHRAYEVRSSKTGINTIVSMLYSVKLNEFLITHDC